MTEAADKQEVAGAAEGDVPGLQRPAAEPSDYLISSADSRPPTGCDSMPPRSDTSTPRAEQNERGQEEDEEVTQDGKRPQKEEESAKGATTSMRCLELSMQAGQVVSRAVCADEDKLQQLVAHGCSLVGNLEVAAVCSSVQAQIDSEASEATWRHTLEDSAREAADTLQEVQQRWKEAVGQLAAVDMADHLQQLKTECDTLLTKKQSLVVRLRQEIEELDNTFLKEVDEHRLKREELLRRLAEHATELCTTSRDTVRHLQSVTEEQRGELTLRCSQLLDAALAEFTADLEELMQQQLQTTELRQQQRVTALLEAPPDGRQLLDQLESQWQQHKSAAGALRLQRSLERPRLQYRLRLLQQQLLAAAEQLSSARRLIICLRPQLQMHRRREEAARAGREKQREVLLRRVQQQHQHVHQLQHRYSSRREHLQKVLRGISAMHCDALASLVHQIEEVEQHIEVQVLGRDRLPGGDDATELRTLMLQEPPFTHSAVTTASPIIRGRTAGECFRAVDDDSASVLRYDHTELEKTFLLGVVAAAAFLVPQERLPLATGARAPEEDAILQLEHIFREVGVSSDADVDGLLHLARCKRLTRAAPISQQLAIKQQAGGADDRSSVSIEDDVISNCEVLDILTEFTKFRRPSSSYNDEKPHFALSTHDDWGRCTAPNDDRRWEGFLDEVCSGRQRTWGIASSVVTQYLAELQGRKKDEETVAELQREAAELQRLQA